MLPDQGRPPGWLTWAGLAGRARVGLLGLLTLAASLGAEPARAVEPAGLLAGVPRGQLIFETAGPRCVLIDIFIASNNDQRGRGLMYVEAMDEFEGMYFGYGQPARIVMWMKNTSIPLDMVFIRADGTVAGIARNTKPQTTDRILSPAAVSGVIEVNGGFARRWRVDVGTRVLLSR